MLIWPLASDRDLRARLLHHVEGADGDCEVARQALAAGLQGRGDEAAERRLCEALDRALLAATCEEGRAVLEDLSRAPVWRMPRKRLGNI